MPTIYRCRLRLLESTFFSSREISNYYQTAPLIGNYALAYALGLCQAPYFNDGSIHYGEHLSALNEQGVYVTPATLTGAPRFRLEQFNAQPDAYWYAMANNVIVTRPDGTLVEKRGSKWYVKETPAERGKAVRLENRPQHGRIRALALDNEAVFYVVSQQPRRLPSYIRLGKFMSKARVHQVTLDESEEVSASNVKIPFLLNPADFGEETTLVSFDLFNVPPTPLVQNSTISGRFYRLKGDIYLPAGMRFGVEGLL